MGGKFGCLVVNQVAKTFKCLELGRFNLFGEAFDLPEIRNWVSGRRNQKKRSLSVWLDFQRERGGELGVLTEGVQAGETAAVFGVGGLGIHAVQLLKIVGCGTIIAIDPREDARANALARGAHFAFAPDDPELKKHRGLNAAFDFAGVTPVRKQALGLLGEQGRLIIIGIANEPIVIPNDMAFTYMHPDHGPLRL